MRRRAFLLAACALATPLAVRGQSGPPKIGAVIHSGTYMPIIDGLRRGLKELGSVEGRDYVLEFVDAKADTKVMEEAARRFERERVKLIYVAPTSAAVPVKRATGEVPVFFCAGTDPVASGLVASYAKPGGRMTGVHYLTTDLTAKRMELLRDLLPKARRVVTFYNPANPVAQDSGRRAREAAKKLGLELIERHVATPAEVRAASAALKAGEFDAFFSVTDALITSQFDALIEVSRKMKLPTVVYDQYIAERGALVSYGSDFGQVGRASAKNVQRILAGAKPADLPVETVTHPSFVLNRRTAREIGVAVPPAMIVRFDRVIE